MSNTITASVSGGAVNASVSGSSASASIGGSSSPVQASISSSGLSASGGPAIAPVQSVNGQIGSVIIPVIPYPPAKPPEMAFLTTISHSGSFFLSVRSSSRYFAVLWWDGSVQIFGQGTTSQYAAASRAVPSSGAWSGSAPKSVIVWPCISPVSPVASGFLTGLACTSRMLTHLSVDGCSMLTELSCDSNRLTSLHINDCPALSSLSCHANSLRELGLSGCLSLRDLSCQANSLRGIDVSKNALLRSLSCSANQLESLDVSQNYGLESLYCNDNRLVSLNLSANTRLVNVNASGNRMTSIRANGVRASGQAGMNVSNNQLNASSLNTLYSDLGNVQSGSVFVSGNPGTSSDDPAIAIAKGYTVYG